MIVVSRGDSDLLNLGGRQAWHFPQTEDGVYAGYYPADSTEAITHLEVLRAKGGTCSFPVRRCGGWSTMTSSSSTWKVITGRSCAKKTRA